MASNIGLRSSSAGANALTRRFGACHDDSGCTALQSCVSLACVGDCKTLADCASVGGICQASHFCGPCAKAHPVLEEIVQHNKDVNVKVIFTATNAESDSTGKPVKHLLAIAANQNAQLTEQALDDWYMADKKDYELFAAKYPMNGELKLQEDKIDLMKKWCDEAEITATPTIFINGKRLPETYNINELKNIF